MDIHTPKRYLGLDAGRTGYRLYYTASDPETGRFYDPTPVTFGGDTQLSSLVVLKPANVQVFMKKGDLLRSASQLPVGITFEQNLKDLLAENNPKANRCVRALVETFAKELKARLSITSFTPEAFTVTVGIPSDWSDQSDAAQNLVNAVKQVGFQDVQVYPDSAAAVLYGIFSGELPVSEQVQSWLVVDAAGSGTWFSVIEKKARSLDLQVREAFIVPWGGDQIDQALYDHLLISKNWTKPKPPNEMQRTALLVLARELKEKYSKQAGQDVALNFRVDGIQDPIELTKPIFESEEVCQPLIKQFENILHDERLEAQPAFQEVERVLLVGGSAYWDFVRQLVKDRWGEGKCSIPKEPDRVIPKGLALVRTGFLPPEPKSDSGIIAFGSETVVQNQSGSIKKFAPLPLPLTPSPESPLGGQKPIAAPQGVPNQDIRKTKEALHKQAWKIIIWCIVAGALFALIVSPIPCAAWPVLLFLEAYMFYAIAKLYGYKLTSGLLWTMLAGLLAISFVLSLAIGEVVSLLTGYLAVWIIKPLVAALIIWGLGASAIYILDRETFKA